MDKWEREVLAYQCVELREAHTEWYKYENKNNNIMH